MLRSTERVPSATRALMQKHEFHTKKQLGQNFLIDARILDDIVDAVAPTSDTVVLEVGPGAGALTVELAKRAHRVIAIEKDEGLRPVLEEALAPYANVDVIYADCLNVNLVDLVKPFLDEGKHCVFAANLPYYITTPILFSVLESTLPLRRAVVMVQREVADRMVAAPGSKAYGVLSVGIQFRSAASRLFTVSPSAFLPQPGVDSAVVLLDCTRPAMVDVPDETRFFRIVRAAFSTRRKTLLNALSGSLQIPKEACRDRIESAGIDAGKRAETLSIEQFARLAQTFADL